MKKRERLDVIYDILKIIQNNKNFIKTTPLMRKSNLPSKRFNEYYKELSEKKFIQTINLDNTKHISLTEKGVAFIDKYKTIKEFVENFGL
jgi:predicted transcriptional regulator